MGKLFIGWGETDITPDITKNRVELAGQYYQRIAKGVHSRLKANAFCAVKDDEQVIMVCLDVVGMDIKFLGGIREAVAAEIPEIKPECVFINCIHTHSAPYFNPHQKLRDGGCNDPDLLEADEFLALVTKQVVAAVKEAWTSKAPGGIAGTLGFARIGHCRRPAYSTGKAEMYGETSRRDFVGLEAGEDSGVDMLFTFDENQRPTGMILNVPCPSQVMEATYYISSDYMGMTREKLKKEFGENFHTLSQISAAGCQAPRDMVRRYRGEPDFWHADGVDVHSDRLIAAVREAFPRTAGKIDYDPIFKTDIHKVCLPKRRAGYPEYVAAVDELKRLDSFTNERDEFAKFCAELHANEAIPGRPGPYDSKLHTYVLYKNNQAVVDRYNEQDANPNFEYDCLLFRFGDYAFVTCPFELYLTYGQIIKARSEAYQTFVVQLCPGGGSYLPTPQAEQLGGYGGMIVNGKCGSDAGYKLVDDAVERINELFK